MCVCICCAVLSAGGHVSVAWPGVSRGDQRCAGRRACAHRPTHGGVYKGRPADLRSVWDLGLDSTDLPSPTSAPGARHPSAPPSQASALGACRFYPSLGASALGACRSCPSLGGGWSGARARYTHRPVSGWRFVAGLSALLVIARVICFVRMGFEM